MKRFKLFLTVSLTCIILLIPCFSAFADMSDYNDFVINNYDVKIDVGEDNTLHVVESIDVKFNEERHGIYRNIPRRFEVKRENGTFSKAKIKLKNFECSDNYELESTLGEYSIQIGDADKYIIGKHQYQLTYDYIIGPDLLEGADELYFNIIGTEWDTRIKNVSFKINMPKAFDASKIGFSAGYAGEVGTEAVEYTVDGDTITGYTTMPLGYSNGLTIRAELPEGYFVFDDTKQNILSALLVIIPALIFAAVLVIWAAFGKDKKIIDVVEFYPPKDSSCVDVAHWYKGMVTGEDVVPLLIELANEGYLTIEEDGASYIIKKVKAYDGKDESKRTFMRGLFLKGDTTFKERLEDEFYIYIDKILLSYNTPENRKKVFDKKSLIMRMLCWLLSVAAICLDFVIYTSAYHNKISTIAFAVGLAVGAAAFVLSFFVRKRTDDGHTVLQQIEGFKTFLETAEKDRLEELVEENPEYFYDILPYAYVLGVSKKWIKKFESIAIEPPSWCSSDYRDFRYLYFINSTLKNCGSAMQSRPADTGSGSVSGGGFSGGSISGGGFGGGGGGSW